MLKKKALSEKLKKKIRKKQHFFSNFEKLFTLYTKPKLAQIRFKMGYSQAKWLYYLASGEILEIKKILENTLQLTYIRTFQLLLYSIYIHILFCYNLYLYIYFVTSFYLYIYLFCYISLSNTHTYYLRRDITQHHYPYTTPHKPTYHHTTSPSPHNLISQNLTSHNITQGHQPHTTSHNLA